MAESNPAVATIEQSREVSSKLGFSVGIDPITILTIAQVLIPVLIKCFQTFHSSASVTATSDQQSAELKSYLLDHYDQNSKTFDQSIVDQCRNRTRRSARKQGQPRLSRNQLDAITTATLERALNSDSASVAATIDEAATFTEPQDQTDDDGSNPAVVL